MFEILKNFESKYGNLKKKGLRIEGMTMIDPKRKKHVINVSRPFLFDTRLIPKKYEGLEVKGKITGLLPDEFKVDREKNEYVWAPERFENYVDRCGAEIRKAFQNPVMTREEMLDALCFGSYSDHKNKTLTMIQEGKIAPYKSN